MDTMELLAWTKGPGLSISLTVLLLGITVRVLEMLILGHKKDLSEARVANSALYGFRTIVTRSLPSMEIFKAETIPLLAGYAFHIGLFLIVFFYVPHILVFKGLLDISWPALPMWLIDGMTLITMASMLIVLWYRLTSKVRRYLSRFGDYFAWLVTFLPVLTGYLTYHRLMLPYNDMLVIHILSVELLFVTLPFTKLMHTVTLFFARYYNGQAAGRKGVKV
jgi:nitrate reductase gamma subunit